VARKSKKKETFSLSKIEEIILKTRRPLPPVGRFHPNKKKAADRKACRKRIDF